jgi:hypothetical protein
MAAASAYVEANKAFLTAFQLVCREDSTVRQTSLKAALDKLEACEEALGIGPIRVNTLKSPGQTSYNALPDSTTPRRRASDLADSRPDTLKSPGQTSSKQRLERIKARLTYENLYLAYQPHPEVPGLWWADAYRVSGAELVFVAGTNGIGEEDALGCLAGELGIQTDVDILDGRD